MRQPLRMAGAGFDFEKLLDFGDGFRIGFGSSAPALFAAPRAPSSFLPGRRTRRPPGSPAAAQSKPAIHPALLFVVFHRARMERRGQTGLDHLLRVEVRERRVQLLEVVKLLEDRFDEVVNDVVRLARRGDQRRAYAVCLGVLAGYWRTARPESSPWM